MYSDSTERIKDTEKENNESVTVDARRVMKILGKVHRNDILGVSGRILFLNKKRNSYSE